MVRFRTLVGLMLAVGLGPAVCRADVVLDGEDPERWVTFAVNCHDWVNPGLSADALGFVMDSLEEVGARAEFYVTAPLVLAWSEQEPEFLDRLRTSNHTISYHTRPPHPAYYPGTSSLLESTALADYERYRLDLTSGALDVSATGGLDLVRDALRLPVGCGTAGATPELSDRFAAHMAARGVRVGVFDHGPVDGLTGFERLLQPELGLYPRPNDYFLSRTDNAANPVESGSNFWWNWIALNAYSETVLVQAFENGFLDGPANPDGSERFAVVIIHDDNFYTSGTPWEPIYFNTDGSAKSPPYDLGLGEVGATRSAAEQARIRSAWRALVQAAAADDDARIVTSADIAGLADTQFNADSAPVRTRTWNESGDFDQAPALPHNWQIGTQNQGTLAIATDAGEAGQGLRAVANAGGSLTVQQRVDVDKGRVYTFGARLKGTGVGSATLRIVGVNRVGNTLTEVANSSASTTPLSGTFDWSSAAASRSVTANFDYLLLQLRITGGGTVQMDDCYVRSDEVHAIAIPAEVAQPVHTGFLIHIENTPALTANTEYFRAKTLLLQDIAALLASHGARMTLQPELEIALGCQAVPGYATFFSDLRTQHGVEVSLHTHGPSPGSPFPEVLDYLLERKTTFEAMGAGPITDLNGNFDVADWSQFSQAGVTSMTAFKNTTTQSGYAGRYFHPWRPAPGNPLIDEAAWAVDNPASTVVYLPGNTTQVTRYTDGLHENLLPGMTAALWNTDPQQATTFYFVMHVDAFESLNGLSLSQYMTSEEYATDLAHYDQFFGEVLDPLRDRGLVQYSTPQEMHAAFVESLSSWPTGLDGWAVY